MRNYAVGIWTEEKDSLQDSTLQYNTFVWFDNVPWGTLVVSPVFSGKRFWVWSVLGFWQCREGTI